MTVSKRNVVAPEPIQALGVDPSNLGCVMLDVVLPLKFREVLPNDWLYSSENLTYVKGIEMKSHVTLLYGLLFSAAEHEAWVLEALGDVMDSPPLGILIDGLTSFEAVDDGIEYSAVVAQVSRYGIGWEFVDECHHRLRGLPHVETFPEYNPHITLAYVQRQFTDDAISLISPYVGYDFVPIKGLRMS